MTVRIPPKDLVSTIVMSEYVRKILLSESPIRLYGQTNPTRSMGQNHVGSLRVGGGVIRCINSSGLLDLSHCKFMLKYNFI